MLKVENVWKCEKCGLVVKISYSMKRHISRMHQQVEAESVDVGDVNDHADISETISTSNVEENSTIDDDMKQTTYISELLKHLNLEQYIEVFAKEMIDLKMLLDLKPEEFMEMVRDIGIVPWGHRHELRKSLEAMKKNLT
jgi:hypothetical protein